MPLFYFLPFKLKSDQERAAETPVVDIKFGDIVLYIAVALILGLIFIGLVVVPAVIALQEAGAAG